MFDPERRKKIQKDYAKLFPATDNQLNEFENTKMDEQFRGELMTLLKQLNGK